MKFTLYPGVRIFFLILFIFSISSCPAGKRELKTGIIRIKNGLCYIPESYNPDKKYPLVFILHGSAGTPYMVISKKYFREAANNRNYILCALKSKYISWVSKKDKFDLKNLKAMIAYMKKNYNINHSKICLFGFSAGGSYTFRIILNKKVNKFLKNLFSTFIVVSGDEFMIENEISENLLNLPKKIPGFILWGKRESISKNGILTKPGRTAAAALDSNGWDITTNVHGGGHCLTEGIVLKAFDWLGSRTE